MDKPIRVATVLNHMNSGGIEAVVMNYYRNTDRSKVQFDFYVSSESEVPQEKELLEMGAQVYRVPPCTHVLEYQRVLRQDFRGKGYKIVHAHMNTMSLFPLFAAWRAGVPVRICHNHSTAHWGEGKKTLLKYILRPFNKIFATHYFACSQQAGEWMFGKNTFRKGKVRVMVNAIDEAKFAYRPSARERIRRELNIPREAKVIGHVGRLIYQKNQQFLFKVMKELEKDQLPVILLLIGGGELEDQLRREAKGMGLEDRVVFAGVRQDVADTYSAMDLFCLPSFYEGFGVVALEAQAAGLPCICSPCVPEEVLEGKNTCRLSIQHDQGVKLWTEKVEEYLDLPRTSGKALSSRYSIRAAAGEMQRWYQEKYKENE